MEQDSDISFQCTGRGQALIYLGRAEKQAWKTGKNSVISR